MFFRTQLSFRREAGFVFYGRPWRKAAISFLELASSGKVDEAYSKYVGEGFWHHNPFFEGSTEALQAGMEENAK